MDIPKDSERIGLDDVLGNFLFGRIARVAPNPSSLDRVNQEPEASSDEHLDESLAPPTQMSPDISLLSAPSTGNSGRGDDCLKKVLELFPDISHQFVNELFTLHKPSALAQRHYEGSGCVDKVVEDILARSSYPKQKDAKRKRTTEEEEEEDQQWKKDSDRDPDALYIHASVQILANDFPHVPTSYIRQLLSHEKRKFYSAYLALASFENPFAASTTPYERLTRARKASSSHVRPFLNGTVARELKAAKRKVEKDLSVARREKEQEEAEKVNEEECTRTGALVECQCCYGDVPSNRAIPCEGADVHFFCFACIRRSANTQIGLMKYQILCFDTSGCQASFGRNKLEQAVGEVVMRKLESLQQQDEIAKAGLDGLEECPFCEFKAICPPVEEDREFRCYNPDCEIISCRLCKFESHVPQTCEEAKKERGVSERHLVEEAMSEALIRPCPRCGIKIVKELGCNKMVCPQCSCLICYICKKDITRDSYRHFRGYGSGTCSVNEDPSRNQEEINWAEKTAIDQIRAENPNLQQEELEVQRAEEREKSRKQARPPDYMLFPLHPQRILRETSPDYNTILGRPQLLEELVDSMPFLDFNPFEDVPRMNYAPPPPPPPPLLPLSLPHLQGGNRTRALSSTRSAERRIMRPRPPGSGFAEDGVPGPAVRMTGVPIGLFDSANVSDPACRTASTTAIISDNGVSISRNNPPTDFSHRSTVATQNNTRSRRHMDNLLRHNESGTHIPSRRARHDPVDPLSRHDGNGAPRRTGQPHGVTPHVSGQTQSRTTVNGRSPVRPEIIDLT